MCPVSTLYYEIFGALIQATPNCFSCLAVPEKEATISQQLSLPCEPASTPSHRPPSPRPPPPTPRIRVHAQPPKFYAIPHNRVAEEGETVRFQCAVSGHPDPFVTWDKDGEVITPSSRITVMERDDLKILEISDVRPDDSGVYRVRLENDLGKIEASAKLEVIKHRTFSMRGLRARSTSPRPAPVYRRTYETLTSRYYGRDARLFSDIRSVPTPYLKYYKNEVAKEASVSPKQEAQVDGEFHPPEIVEALPKTKSIYEGNPLILEAKVKGTEPLDVVWMKDGCVVTDGEGVDQYCRDGVVGLMVKEAFLYDAGDYRCEVYGPYGEAMSRCSVQVKGT